MKLDPALHSGDYNGNLDDYQFDTVTPVFVKTNKKYRWYTMGLYIDIYRYTNMEAVAEATEEENYAEEGCGWAVDARDVYGVYKPELIEGFSSEYTFDQVLQIVKERGWQLWGRYWYAISGMGERYDACAIERTNDPRYVKCIQDGELQGGGYSYTIDALQQIIYDHNDEQREPEDADYEEREDEYMD